MTDGQYEHFTELIGYNNELVKIKEILNKANGQFGGKCFIGNRPREFYLQLIKIIDEEMNQIKSDKLKI